MTSLVTLVVDVDSSSASNCLDALCDNRGIALLPSLNTLVLLTGNRALRADFKHILRLAKSVCWARKQLGRPVTTVRMVVESWSTRRGLHSMEQEDLVKGLWFTNDVSRDLVREFIVRKMPHQPWYSVRTIGRYADI